MAIFPEFETELPIRTIKAILVEHLGMWDVVLEPRLESVEFRGYMMYSWVHRGIRFILGDGKKKHYYDFSGYRGKRTAKRIARRLSMEDPMWIFRKLLSAATDPRRLKRYDVKVYIPFALIGVTLAAASLVLSLLQIGIGVPLTLIGAYSTPLLYGLYRYGEAEEAIDIRLFSIGLQWIVAFYGIPFSIIMLAIAFYLPTAINLILYLAALVGFYLIIRQTFNSLFRFPKKLNRKPRSTWPEIRKKLDDDEKVWKPGQRPSAGYRMGEVAQLKFLSTFGVAYTMGLVGVFYGIIKYMADSGLIGAFEAILYLAFLLVILVIFGAISIDMGFRIGLSQVRENYTNSIEVTLNSDGIVEFKPIINWNSLLSRILTEDSPTVMILRGDAPDFLKFNSETSKETSDSAS